MKRLAFLFSLLLIAGSPLLLGAGDYTIEELVDENATTSPPFSISHVVPFPDGLRFFPTTDSPDAVADLLTDGALQAELSDHETETATAVSLSLGEAIWCSQDGDPFYLAYQDDPLVLCGAPPARIEYYLEVVAALGPGRDLAIGQDPDFLWLIEEAEQP